jgi:hypothetical protein
MMRANRRLHAIAVVIAFAGILLVQVYGCGNPVDRYVEKVLSRWPAIEARTEWLVQGLEGLAEEGGAERLWLLAGEARQATDSFRQDLDRRILVPDYQEKFNGLLIAFLADYGSYLGGLQEYLDVAMLGAEGEVPELESLATRARQSLGDYQDAQEYNGATVEEEVWGLAKALQAAALQQPAPDPAAGTDLEPPPVPGPEDALAAWYGSFSRGDGEAMYYLLSPYSPILEEYGAEDLSARVREAHASGIEAGCEIMGVETAQEEGMDWAVIQVAVDYGESAPEEFTVELDHVEGLWLVTRVNSPSGIW